jgi:hypothetical protein
MAIFTSLKKYFEVTAVSFTPNIITAGEETTYRISVKNVSGKKITSMCADMKLYYRTTVGNVMGSNMVYMYSGNLEYNFKSISWANGVTKEFEGKFVFTPIYPPNIDTRLLPTYKGSDAGFTSSPFADARLGLMLNFTTSATFADGSNTDHFCDLRGENSENLYVIDARYKPTIAKFSSERSRNYEAFDEGESLLTNIRLDKSAAARPEYMSMYLRYRDKTKPESELASENLTDLVNAALTGEIQTEINKVVFKKNTDWELELWFGDKYESITRSFSVPRAFANVHLSGKRDGGVCFGSFSKATDGNPLFQCYYPAEFEEGIKGGLTYESGEVRTGGKWIDGNPIYRRVIVANAGSSSSIATIDTIADFVSLVRIYGAARRASTNTWYNIPTYGSDSVWNDVYVMSDGSVRARSSFGSDAVFYVVVEYTKPKPKEEAS